MFMKFFCIQKKKVRTWPRFYKAKLKLSYWLGHVQLFALNKDILQCSCSAQFIVLFPWWKLFLQSYNLNMDEYELLLTGIAHISFFQLKESSWELTNKSSCRLISPSPFCDFCDFQRSNFHIYMWTKYRSFWGLISPFR